MTTKLCELWAAVCTKPDRASLERVRREAASVADHIDECPACGERVPADVAAIAAVYEALAGDVPSAWDEAGAELLKLRGSVDSEVREAVEGILYSSLPRTLVQQALTWDSLSVFRGIDAVAMLLQRELGDGHASAFLSEQGLRSSARGEHVSASVIVREVRIMTQLGQAEAEAMFGWLLEAARAFPQLMPGVTGSALRGGEIECIAVAQPLELDLASQWAPQPDRALRP